MHFLVWSKVVIYSSIFKIDDVKFPTGKQPRCVVLLVGTNDMARNFILPTAEKSFYGLLHTTKTKFPSSKVCFSVT